MTIDFSVEIGLLTLLIGAGMGFLYFGGLWLTLTKTVHQKNALPLGLLSFLLRIFLLGAGFYFSLQFGWIYLFSTFIGLLLMRTLLIQRIKPTA